MTCPLSLGAIILLLVVIFYSKNITIVFVAAGVLLTILLKFGDLRPENFVPSSGLAENPNDTGINRPMFGPLYPVTSKAMRNNRYRTMHGLPWCESPLGETQDGEVLCNQRNGIPGSEIPYELDKI